MNEALAGRNVAILGGGFTGLTVAYRLLQAGANVTIYEEREGVGGLSASANFGDFWWDRYYHCILTSDAPLLKLIQDLDLADQLVWRQTKVGLYIKGKLYSLSSLRDYLLFPHLSLWHKFRFAFGILFCCSIRDGIKLEAVKVSEWLKRVFGAHIYETMWEPLLRCKLGDCRHDASAAFIWATITRLYSTREKNNSHEERLGYVRGGYRTVFNRLRREVDRLGGQFRLGFAVKSVSKTTDGLCVVAGEREQACSYDEIIATIPSVTLARIAPELGSDYRRRLLSAKYLGIVCVVLVLKRQLTPYYVTNLADNDVPFTGIIEMSNLIASSETAGHRLVYLPKYTAPDDPLFQASEEEIWKMFKAGLARVITEFEDSMVVSRQIFRERYVQPVPTLHYSSQLPAMQSDIPGLFLANTAQIINSTLNNNAMVKIADRAVERLMSARRTAE